MTRGLVAAIAGLALMTMVFGDTVPVWARAGSGGSRGSRSYSAPRSLPSQPRVPSSPSRSYTPPPPAPAPAAPRPGLFGGFLGGLAGFALGGLLGGLLFGSRGFGVGFLDLVLIGVAIALLLGFLKRRRESAEGPAYAVPPGSSTFDSRGAPDERSIPTTGTAPVSGGSDADRDLDRGITHIRQMDAGFDP